MDVWGRKPGEAATNADDVFHFAFEHYNDPCGRGRRAFKLWCRMKFAEDETCRAVFGFVMTRLHYTYDKPAVSRVIREPDATPMILAEHEEYFGRRDWVL